MSELTIELRANGHHFRLEVDLEKLPPGPDLPGSLAAHIRQILEMVGYPLRPLSMDEVMAQVGAEYGLRRSKP